MFIGRRKKSSEWEEEEEELGNQEVGLAVAAERSSLSWCLPNETLRIAF